jgi:curved DNA-binding protein CbpA
MTQTYYQVLEVQPDAESIDIKKAYRRLALQYHPDRNQGSAESTERFQQIGEAYDVLGNPETRRQYDLSLKGGINIPSAGVYRPGRPHRDAYAQFNDLFRNDPFFHEAFREMDDVFSRKFTASEARGQTEAPQGWFPWFLNKCGINFQMTTYTSTGDGNFAASSYSSPAAGGTTDKRTRTFTDNQGRKVTIQSMERNGNRIEDKYINQTLVERRVNGAVEPLERIQS